MLHQDRDRKAYKALAKIARLFQEDPNHVLSLSYRNGKIHIGTALTPGTVIAPRTAGASSPEGPGTEVVRTYWLGPINQVRKEL